MRFMAFRPAGLRLKKREPRQVPCGQKEPSAAHASGLVFVTVHWRSLRQYGVSPPSALTACPRMIMASSLKRKEIVRATSTGSMCRTNCELTSCGKTSSGGLSGELAIGDRDLAQHVGRHAPRANAIDVDVVRGERRGEDAGHIDERRLAGAVGQRLDMPLLPGLGSDADDRASRA